MNERLEWILSHVNSWLAFAEAKNGAILVLDGALLIASAQVAADHWPANELARVYVVSAWACLAVAILVALFSFLPKTQIPLLKPKQTPADTDNLLFFGHIKKYSARTYLTHVADIYEVHVQNTRLETDLATQIVTNARIATWKYTCFKVALWASVCAILSPVVGPLALALLHAWSQAHD